VGDPIHAAPDQAPIDPSGTRAAVARALTVGDPIHAALDQAPIDPSVIHAARARALTVVDPIHAAPDRALIDPSVTRAALGRATVVDPTHAAPDRAPIDPWVIHAARARAPTVGDPIHAAPHQAPIDPLVIHAARARAPTAGDPIHAAPGQELIDLSAIRAVLDRPPIVGDPIHAALGQALIDPSVTRAALGWAQTVGDPTHAAPDQAPIDPLVIRAVPGQAPIEGAPILGAPHRLTTAQAAILAAAIPARRGLPLDHDGRVLVVDIRGLAPGANQVPIAIALIAPNPRAAAPPQIPVLQHLSRPLRSLILTWVSSMLQSETPMPPSESLMPSMLLAAIPIHNSMRLTLLEKGRILTSMHPRLIAPNPARVGPRPLLAVAAPRVAQMLKASACRRCYLAQASRRAARLRTGFALAASPSTANLPCLVPACLPPTNCASTAASFANARPVAALPHS
jgi:hypothetical protein